MAGDGTTSVVVICGALLKKCQELLEKGVHPTIISDSFSNAATKACSVSDRCLGFMSSCGTKININLGTRTDIRFGTKTNFCNHASDRTASALTALAHPGFAFLHICKPTHAFGEELLSN